MATFLQWLLDLISNPLFVIGLLFMLLASFLKDEKSVDAKKFKPASLFRKTLRPLPVWAYTTLLAAGILISLVGVVQISLLMGPGSGKFSRGAWGVLALDNLPFWTYSYGFGADFKEPPHFSNLIMVNDVRTIKTYKLEYSMPLQGDAAAGVSFTLAEPLDLTGYAFIEVSAKFTNSQCDLFLKNESANAAPFVTISDTVAASLQSPLVNGKWMFKIPLSNFDTIDQHKVQEIGCNAHRCEQNCIIELSEIQFSKR